MHYNIIMFAVTLALIIIVVKKKNVLIISLKNPPSNPHLEKLTCMLLAPAAKDQGYSLGVSYDFTCE